MNNKNTTEKEMFVNELVSLFFDEEKNEIFTDRDLSRVKLIIANHYFNNELVLSKVSKNKNFRIKYVTPKFVENLVNDFSKNIKPESQTDNSIEILNCLNSFEEEYYDDTTFIKSLSIIHRLLVRHHQEYLKISPQEEELKNSYIDFFKILFLFFKKVTTHVKINQQNGSVYLNLYNQVKTIFTDRNFSSSEVFFKFYHLYIENTKDSVINITEVDNVVNQFLSTQTLNAQRIKSDILSVESVDEFFARRNYKATIYNLAKTNVNYMEVFYSDFQEGEKMKLLNNWVQFNNKKTLEILLRILKNIDFSIPDEDMFGSNIVQQLNLLSTLEQKQKLLDVFFNLNLSENFDYSEYSQFIVSNICSKDINNHLFGIKQYEARGKFINSENLKEKAVPFLLARFDNLNAYHGFFENILKLKIGIDKRHFDEQVRKTTNAVANIGTYLIQTGNSQFFEIISTKLSKYTIGIIGERIIDNINSDPKFKELILSLNKKRDALKKDTITKLEDLLFLF